MEAINIDDEGNCANCGSNNWKRESVYIESLILELDGSVYDATDIDYQGPVEGDEGIPTCGRCGLTIYDEPDDKTYDESPKIGDFTRV